MNYFHSFLCDKHTSQPSGDHLYRSPQRAATCILQTGRSAGDPAKVTTGAHSSEPSERGGCTLPTGAAGVPAPY